MDSGVLVEKSNNARVALLVALVGCAAPIQPGGGGSTPSGASTPSDLPNMGDPGFVARIDADGGGVGFWMIGDINGDGAPDLMVTSDPGTVYLVPGPITADLRVEDAASMVFSTASELDFMRIADTDADGADELVVQRGVEGLVRVELPLTPNVDFDALPLAVDFGGRFGEGGNAFTREIDGGVWVHGVTPAENLAEAWLIDGDWSAPRTLDDARLHLWAAQFDSGDAVFGNGFGGQVKPVGDLDASGTEDAGIYNPGELFDLALEGDFEVIAPWDQAFGSFWGPEYSGIGDVDGDGVDDLLIDGAERPGDAGCVMPGPIDPSTPGLSYPAPDACALLLTEAAGGLRAGSAWPLGDVDGDGFADWLFDNRVIPGGLTGSHELSDVALATHVVGPVVWTADSVPVLGRLEAPDGPWGYIAQHDPPASGVSDPPQPDELRWWELIRVVP